jgi:hypothetical protein
MILSVTVRLCHLEGAPYPVILRFTQNDGEGGRAQ